MAKSSRNSEQQMIFPHTITLFPSQNKGEKNKQHNKGFHSYLMTPRLYIRPQSGHTCTEPTCQCERPNIKTFINADYS
jgi:hypothetical protein